MVIEKIVNEQQLAQLAKNLAHCCNKMQNSLCIYLIGNLGAGKTTFARAFITYFGFKKVKSPSYSIVESYPIASKSLTPDVKPLAFVHHFDCYRLAHPEELETIGIRDYIQHNICLFEWPNKAKGVLPKAHISLIFNDSTHPKNRLIHLKPHHHNGKKLLLCLKLA